HHLLAIAGIGDGGQDADDGHHDHQLDQGHAIGERHAAPQGAAPHHCSPYRICRHDCRPRWPISGAPLPSTTSPPLPAPAKVSVSQPSPSHKATLTCVTICS